MRLRECAEVRTRVPGNLRLGARPLSTSLPAIAAVLLPKCPMCFAGLLGLLGVDVMLADRFLLPLAIVCVAATAALLLAQARRRRSWIAFLLYLPAAAMIVAGRLYFQNGYLTAAGAVALALVMVWLAVNAYRKPLAPCHAVAHSRSGHKAA